MQNLFTRVAVPAAVLMVACSCDDSPSRVNNHNAPPDTTVLLEIPEPYSNHNGGGLTFDNDGYLYLGLGDGGGAGDNDDNGQDRTTLLGSILRLEVTDTAPYYAIPADNPFAGNTSGWREEIYAWGLRNPWRISVDPETNTLWAGDVGQNVWEEVDIIESGNNYGWDCREGMHDFTGDSSPACATATNLVDPVYEYQHLNGNVSITGGYVYRGTSLPALVGRYIFADYGSGRIWALDQSAKPFTAPLVVDAPFSISSFGVGTDGELYILQYASSAKIYRLNDDGGGAYSLVEAFPDLTFTYPVDLRAPGDGSGRLFVVQQQGTIVAFDAAAADSMWTVLDVTGRVSCCGERGLLGLAFHPDFASNGYIYVYYTAAGTGAGRLSRIKLNG